MVLDNKTQLVLLGVAAVSCFVYIYRPFGIESYYYSKASRTCCEANINEDRPLDRFCVIITVFSRTDLTLQLLKHYSKLPRLTRIIIVWNNKNITPPLEEWDKLGPHSVPVHFKVQERNSLMNKLQLFPEIDTPGVLLVDDDLLISQEDVEFAFDIWKQSPHLIVGWYPRQHGRDSNGHYKYQRSFERYSILLTNAAFVHREYMRIFPSEEVPESARKLVDKLINCEDILFNVMVAFCLKKSGTPQCPGLYARPRDIKDIQETSKNQESGLSLRGDHMKERDLCLNKFAEIYGEMPLMYSSITAVQFKRSLNLSSGVQVVETI